MRKVKKKHKKILSILLILYCLYLGIIIIFVRNGPLLPGITLYEDLYMADSYTKLPVFGTCRDYCNGRDITLFEKRSESFGLSKRTKTNMCFGSVESGC